MPTKDQLLASLEKLLKELNANAEELVQVSCSTISEKELLALQEQQEELLNKIQETDEALKKYKVSPFQGAPWERIEGEVDRFHDLNQQFIDNLKVRQGLIQFELQEIRRAKTVLQKVKSSYKTAPDQRPSNKRVDTTS